MTASADVTGRLKRPVRALRAWPPLNHPATAIARAALGHSERARELLARYLPRAGLVEAPLPEGGVLRLWSRADDDVASAVYWRGWAGHEPETARVFYELARSARTTLDLGAHVGYFALLAAHANRAGHVYAFEPMPRVYERLRRNIEFNGVRNVSSVPMAVADGTREAALYHAGADGPLPSSSSLSRSFAQSAFVASRLTSSSVRVACVDEFVEAHGIRGVDLVKIDTEGTEPAAVRGMERLLARERPSIVCEVLASPAAEEIEAVLRPVGYEFFSLTDLGPQRSDHIRPQARWRNFLFAGRR